MKKGESSEIIVEKEEDGSYTLITPDVTETGLNVKETLNYIEEHIK